MHAVPPVLRPFRRSEAVRRRARPPWSPTARVGGGQGGSAARARGVSATRHRRGRRRETVVTYAIETEGLTKRFGSTQALAGVDLAAREGTVLGVLGPNGAGKTTAVRILATLLQPDAGSARVAGLDVVREAGDVRALVGLTGQYASVDEDLTGTQNLLLIGQLLGLPTREARARAAELLEWFDLTEAAGRTAKTSWGGMPRRRALAASLVGRPSVIVLDEPTTWL